MLLRKIGTIEYTGKLPFIIYSTVPYSSFHGFEIIDIQIFTEYTAQYHDTVIVLILSLQKYPRLNKLARFQFYSLLVDKVRIPLHTVVWWTPFFLLIGWDIIPVVPYRIVPYR